MNLDREIKEGWTPRLLIEEMNPLVKMIMEGGSYIEPFKNKKELTAWLKDNQPFIKKTIPEVVNHFANKYDLK